MAEEQAKGGTANQAAGTGKKKQTFMMVGILLAVMLVEGGGIYFAVKFMGGGPSAAVAEGLISHEGAAGEGGGHGGGDGHGGTPAVTAVKDMEVPVVRFKAPNMKTGRLFLYDMEIFAKVRREKADEVKDIIEAKKATVEDRLNRVVRGAEPQDLHEDGLETIRRQVKHELDQILGDEKMVEEILIPRCTPFKVDY